MNDDAAQYETPLRSSCHQAILVWYRPDAGRYVAAWPSDPNLARIPAPVLRCGRCNSLN
jgi:hypothetical protein